MKMKYILFTVLICFLVAFSLNAQTRFGVIGGVNLANVEIEEEDAGTENMTGFGIGGVLELGFSALHILLFQKIY